MPQQEQRPTLTRPTVTSRTAADGKHIHPGMRCAWCNAPKAPARVSFPPGSDTNFTYICNSCARSIGATPPPDEGDE